MTIERWLAACPQGSPKQGAYGARSAGRRRCQFCPEVPSGGAHRIAQGRVHRRPGTGNDSQRDCPWAVGEQGPASAADRGRRLARAGDRSAAISWPAPCASRSRELPNAPPARDGFHRPARHRLRHARRDHGAIAGPVTGQAIRVLGSWEPSELAKMINMVAPFEKRTGYRVDFVTTRDLKAVLDAAIEAGDPPDIAGLPGPGYMAELAHAGPPRRPRRCHRPGRLQAPNGTRPSSISGPSTASSWASS